MEAIFGHHDNQFQSKFPKWLIVRCYELLITRDQNETPRQRRGADWILRSGSLLNLD